LHQSGANCILVARFTPPIPKVVENHPNPVEKPSQLSLLLEDPPICIIIGFTSNKFFMKKTNNHPMGENTKIALYAAGFLSLVMALSYLYWFA
jgi:hypothetical protein